MLWRAGNCYILYNIYLTFLYHYTMCQNQSNGENTHRSCVKFLELELRKFFTIRNDLRQFGRFQVFLQV